MKRDQIKTWLDSILGEFNRKDYLASDPISLVHRYERKEDQEVVGLISALLAFGNVTSIIGGVQKILDVMGNSPTEFLLSQSQKDLTKKSRHLYYRFYNSNDIAVLLTALSKSLQKNKSLQNVFVSGRSSNPLITIRNFQQALLKDVEVKKSPGLKFMFSDPIKGTSKRWHMFLRWMVRKDDVDLGLWSEISPQILIQPLDTHLFDIGRELKLIKRKTLCLNAALEMTDAFRAWDEKDPIKYDFALCRLGVLGLKGQKIKELQQRIQGQTTQSRS